MEDTTSQPLALRDQKPGTLAVDPAASALSVQQVLGQVALIQQIMSTAMQDGQHYGTIPGCGTKPTLLKPGAEKLCLTFRLAPTYVVEERLLERGHREYRVQTTLTSIISQAFIGQGVGVCSTMEAKYRFRKDAGEPTDKPVPRAYWDLRGEDPKKAQELLGGKGFSAMKVEGKGWMIATGGGKTEHDNPADHYNTVLKMAKKRALVDAVLTATAASDIFTQDLEDITANLALAGAEHQPTASNQGCSLRRVDSGAVAPRASAPAPATSSTEKQRYDADPHQGPSVPVNDPVDFRETRIHFGKNRGLMLSELSPQQVHWYEHDWMPKKKVIGPTSVEDLALINALERYNDWRSTHRTAPASKPQGGQAAPVEAKPEDQSQEQEDVRDQFQRWLKAAKLSEDEMEAYLRRKKFARRAPLLGPDAELPGLPDASLEIVMHHQDEVRREIIEARREREKKQLLQDATHN